MKSDFSIGGHVRINAIGEVRRPRLAGKMGAIVGRTIWINSRGSTLKRLRRSLRRKPASPRYRRRNGVGAVVHHKIR